MSVSTPHGSPFDDTREAVGEADLPCTAASIRRASRRITQVYDDALKPFGLKLTQFSVLATIKRLEGPSITQLADHLGMDRTTLTRNLAPLRAAGWVQTVSGADKRSRAVRLTNLGSETLEDARPAWREAEHRLREIVGDDRSRTLRRLLSETVSAVAEAQF